MKNVKGLKVRGQKGRVLGDELAGTGRDKVSLREV